jgi:hypothetical protein
LGEYPEIIDYEQKAQYPHYEMDFGRRLVAKFRFDPTLLWHSTNFPQARPEALYPTERRDQLLPLTEALKNTLTQYLDSL